MQELTNLFHGFAVSLSPENLLLMLVGVVLGVIIGVLPGLGGANGVAILLPLTFSMNPTSAIIMLSCIYWGALFGGAITSILFNIPGEPWSVATTFDGYPMAQKGRAAQALTAAFTSSFVGALVAVLLITFLSPVVAGFALRFGPPEFFSVYLLTFAAFIGTSAGSPARTIVSMGIGFALATVGMDTMTGELRLTFGVESLLKGFDFLIAVIGLFGIGEILATIEEGLSFRGARAKLSPKLVLETWKELPRYWMTSLKSSAIGCLMGIIPGGATPASFMAYAVAQRGALAAGTATPMERRSAFTAPSDFTNTRPALARTEGDDEADVEHDIRRAGFGKGRIEGVVAPETAAHAAGTSALLPMLTLGVPGSPTAAVLLGGLLIWGLQPGPMMFKEQGEFVWGLIASMYLGNVAGLIVVLTCVPLFASILRVPFTIMAPLILAICAIGAYTVHNSMFDVYLMLAFGLLGYVLKKLDYPLAPLVLALVLGDRMEDAFRQSMLLSSGNLGVLFSNPLVGSITGLSIALLVYPLVLIGLAKLRKRRTGTARALG